jgi:hypothetical protein
MDIYKGGPVDMDKTVKGIIEKKLEGNRIKNVFLFSSRMHLILEDGTEVLIEALPDYNNVNSPSLNVITT